MSVAIATEQSVTFANGIKLDSGRILAPITLAYETYGTLNATASNAILVGVLEAGADYEYLSVGDALVAGFHEDFSGRRLSDIIATTPRFGLGLKMLYEMVRSGCEPLYYRGWVGADMPDAQFIYYESAVLPFGKDQTQVDHILVTSMLVLRDQAYPAMPQSLRV